MMSAAPELSFRIATAEDAATLADLVRTAYRGDSSRVGWTTEADLLDDERIDAAGVAGKITADDGAVLVVQDEQSEIIGCCELVNKGNGVAYFGMFAIAPARQAGGIGRIVLAEAERYASHNWQAKLMEMTVIAQRTELIEWYLRRGYHNTGETRPFPYHALVNGQARRDDLVFVVLAKQLDA
jgi:ribosomal protein S18 acetylase RimI-like enzyme